MQFFITIIAVCCLAIFGFLGLGEALRCEHEETQTVYHFQFEKSSANSYMQDVCEKCGQTSNTIIFRGAPTKQSYMELIEAHSDSDEIIAGEYYTVTATVTSITLDHYDSFWTVRTYCKLENEDIRISFSVDFRKEFWEQVDMIEKGDEITFRGQFYDTGFKDAELITD